LDNTLRYRDETAQAFYVLDLALGQSPAEVSAKFDEIMRAVDGKVDASAQYAHPFDKIVFDLLTDVSVTPAASVGQSIDPPLNTDVTFLRESVKNRVFGVWLRSFEAFNDPRLSDEELRQSITFFDTDSGQVDVNCKLCISRDRTQALLINPAGLKLDGTAIDVTRRVWVDRVLTDSSTVRISVSYNEVI